MLCGRRVLRLPRAARWASSLQSHVQPQAGGESEQMAALERVQAFAGGKVALGVLLRVAESTQGTAPSKSLFAEFLRACARVKEAEVAEAWFQRYQQLADESHVCTLALCHALCRQPDRAWHILSSPWNGGAPVFPAKMGERNPALQDTLTSLARLYHSNGDAASLQSVYVACLAAGAPPPTSLSQVLVNAFEEAGDFEACTAVWERMLHAHGFASLSLSAHTSRLQTLARFHKAQEAYDHIQRLHTGHQFRRWLSRTQGADRVGLLPEVQERVQNLLVLALRAMGGPHHPSESNHTQIAGAEYVAALHSTLALPQSPSLVSALLQVVCAAARREQLLSYLPHNTTTQHHQLPPTHRHNPKQLAELNTKAEELIAKVEAGEVACTPQLLTSWLRLAVVGASPRRGRKSAFLAEYRRVQRVARRDRVSLEVGGFQLVLQGLAREALVNQIPIVVAAIGKRGYRLDQQMYQAIFLCFRNDLRQRFRAWPSNKPQRVDDQVLEFDRQMRKDGIHHTTASLCDFLSVVGRDPRFFRMLTSRVNAFDAKIESGKFCPLEGANAARVRVLGAAINACAITKQEAQARKFYARAQALQDKPDPLVCAAMIRVVACSGHPDQCWEFIKPLEQYYDQHPEVAPVVKPYNVLLQCVLSTGKGMRAFDLLLARGLTPSPVSLKTLTRWCISRHHFEDAFRVLCELRKLHVAGGGEKEAEQKLPRLLRAAKKGKRWQSSVSGKDCEPKRMVDGLPSVADKVYFWKLFQACVQAGNTKALSGFRSKLEELGFDDALDELREAEGIVPAAVSA